jgi:hypothetical protein
MLTVMQFFGSITEGSFGQKGSVSTGGNQWRKQMDTKSMKGYDGLWFRWKEKDTCALLWELESDGNKFRWFLDHKGRYANCSHNSSSIYSCVDNEKYLKVGPLEASRW